MNLSIHLSKAYLDLAKSFEPKKIIGNPSGGQKNEFVYAIYSLKILYSYLAIEAFINRKLYDVVLDVIKVNDNSAAKIEGYDISEFIKFGKKYNSIQSYDEELLWKDLGKRINELCKVYGIRKICDVHADEWQVFVKINKLVRDKIVHPNSEVIKFSKISEIILDSKFVAIVPEISSAMIKHFFVEKGAKIPQYLLGSYSFKVSEVKFY